MIETITGTIASINPAAVVVETAAGIGFELNITLPTFSAIENRTDVRLLVHENIREDAWVLYGFLTAEERDMFRLLIGVSGVGASSARLILSAISAPELGAVIASGDVKQLKSVKGIGTKTAERIIVDLKDKIKAVPSTLLE
ncbi:MAG: Holliday junction branch migration protein RuvA, partial [Muribaculaceae bacterium]|nr:Holliday junction branch migration protein RuvA [Muribaculaceae bacterium]